MSYQLTTFTKLPKPIVSTAEKIELCGSPFKSVDTSSFSVYRRIPLSGPSAAFFITALMSAGAASLPRMAVKSTTLTVGVGTRKAMPVNLPWRAGMTRPTAFAAPVLEGTMFRAAARASRRSLAAVSTVFCEFV